MRNSLLSRRVLLKLGGGSVVAGMMATSPTAAQTEDSETGRVNDLIGFETPLPITNNSHRLQLISPANRLTIDAETDDAIDLVFEWDDAITIGTGGRSISGSIGSLDEEDISEQRAIFRGKDWPEDIVYDNLTLRGVDTSDVDGFRAHSIPQACSPVGIASFSPFGWWRGHYRRLSRLSRCFCFSSHSTSPNQWRI